jgi:hypothetical protein
VTIVEPAVSFVSFLGKYSLCDVATVQIVLDRRGLDK